MKEFLLLFEKFCINSKAGMSAFHIGNIEHFLIYFKQFLYHYHLDNDLQSYIGKLTDKMAVINNETIEKLSEIFMIPEFAKATFLKSYPKFIQINNKMYPGFTGDIDKLCEEYCKKINYSIDKHKEVLSLIKYGKDTGILNIGFEKFVLSYYWETLKELKQEKNEISFESDDV